MPGEYSHEHPVTIHHGPMAGKRGSDWEDDARKLEELNAKRIENPMKTPPDDLTSIDKAHAARSKSDEGRWDQSESTVGGDDIKI
ncbi:MAG TPA: hypothetical protein VD969_25545 [Symbiobacteriaceae bacterium]|nr:hypothetical protein [Symbiobacteriaceae bacterium]